MHNSQALVAKDKEPITPFIAKVRPLVDRGVSCILVIGGSGDYFDVADVVRFCAFLFPTFYSSVVLRMADFSRNIILLCFEK